MDVAEDEGCAMVSALRSQGFKVVFEKITRKRRQH